ncbi:MAG TPA: hypothetical protein VK192_05385, partial [Sphingomicrobium sp.]|nr:hypothetical protein [Sphingomicrobium sp.]
MNEQPRPPKRIFPSSKVDAKSAEHVPSIPQTESGAYKLAFQDNEFLLRDDLRPVRRLDRVAERDVTHRIARTSARLCPGCVFSRRGQGEWKGLRRGINLSV